MRHLLIIGLFLPSTALAYTCSFTTECYENEACQETAYEMTVTPSDDWSTADVSSITGDFTTTASNFAGASSFTGSTTQTMHMITIAGRGPARYSVHMGSGDETTVITYLGTCE